MIHHICHEDKKLPYRIFAVEIENCFFYWASNGGSDFREDMKSFYTTVKDVDARTLEVTFGNYMLERGYVPVSDLVEDIFSARVFCTRARLIPTGD